MHQLGLPSKTYSVTAPMSFWTFLPPISEYWNLYPDKPVTAPGGVIEIVILVGVVEERLIDGAGGFAIVASGR